MLVCHKSTDFLWCRRKSHKVEAQPADQRVALGLRRRRNMVGFQASENEAVDRIADPGGSPNLRRLRPPDGLKGPMPRPCWYGSRRIGDLGSLVDPRA